MVPKGPRVSQVLERLVLQVQLLATSVLYSNIRREMELQMENQYNQWHRKRLRL